jgi:dihydrofolate reductase
MSIVNNLINDLINEHKILSDCLFVEYSAIISEHFHHSVDNIHDKARRNIVLGGGHKVYAELLGEEVVQSLNILQNSKIMGNLRMKEEDHRPKGSLFYKTLRRSLSRDLVGL